MRGEEGEGEPVSRRIGVGEREWEDGEDSVPSKLKSWICHFGKVGRGKMRGEEGQWGRGAWEG